MLTQPLQPQLVQVTYPIDVSPIAANRQRWKACGRQIALLSCMSVSDLTCVCGKIFAQSSSFSNHRKACKVSKEKLTGLLTKAKDAWKGRKRTFAEARLQISRQTLNEPPRVSQRRRLDVSGQYEECHQDGPQDDPRSSQQPAGALSQTMTALAEIEAEARSPPEAAEEPATINKDPSNAIRTRSGRLSIRPARYLDVLPAPLKTRVRPPPSVKDSIRDSSAANGTTRSTDPSSHPPFRTEPNVFGLLCQYDSKPDTSHAPNNNTTIDDLSDIPNSNASKPVNSHRNQLARQLEAQARTTYAPYPNESSFLLGEWFWNGSGIKSKTEFHKLLDILTDASFNLADIQATSWDRIDRTLGESSNSEWIDEFQDAGWIQEKVSISVPFHNQMGSPGPKNFEAGHFYRRSVVSVLKERLASAEGRNFHFEPFELYWQPPGTSDETRVYGELYTSPAFIEAHQKLQNSPREPGCSLPRVVVALMFGSDETHLTQFGDSKLWPLYMFFGNDSKYRRSKASLALCNHLAYFIKLPESFKDFVRDFTGGKAPTPALTAHCLRELLHTQWELIIDEEFVQAYLHGVVIKCFDNIMRRFYLRIFTHSADYKEKVLLTGIHNLGKYPCPRCLTPLLEVYRMGMKGDQRFRLTRARIDNAIYRGKISTARNIIYKHNRAVNNADVKAMLQEMSLVPTQNAFSAKLSKYGFNVFSTMVVDLMHEVESGNWRSLFIHILRILTSVDEQLVHEMDRRYALPFIGKFQHLEETPFGSFACAIPVFDGLLSGVGNTLLLELLFVYAQWHGLAKLRLHTDATLTILTQETEALGKHMRKFKQKTSTLYNTRELKKEQAARLRRKQLAAMKKKPNEAGRISAVAQADVDTANNQNATTVKANATSGRRRKFLNLKTYKFHALGDYAATIRHLGTTDSYSTETGKLEHRTPKSRYSRTSKKNYVQQLSQIERRQARIRHIREKLSKPQSGNPKSCSTSPHDPMEATSPTVQYVIGRGQNEPENLFSFMRTHCEDPATQGFMSKLRRHLLPRARRLVGLPDTEEMEGFSIFFQAESMYRHRTIRFNYTTYDVRRAQDVVNPTKSQCNVLLLADNSDDNSQHPFLYCRVLGIFHVNLVCTGINPTDPFAEQTHRLDFLWVRWYRHHSPTSPLRLDTLTFPPIDQEDAFGFVDPKHVLRACHVIPRFSVGQPHDENSPISDLAQNSADWLEYYVGRFADRDLLMRSYWGLGVGHTYSYSASGSECATLLMAGTTSEDARSDNEGQEEESEHANDNRSIRSASSVSSHTRSENDGLEDDFKEREDEDLGSDADGSEESDRGSDSDGWEI